VAEQALRELGLAEPTYLRHPGHGGNATFRAGLAQYCPVATLQTAGSKR
jgi:hypothetical protein